MTITAGEIITTARDAHPAFGPERSPDGVCLRFLDGFVQDLVTELLVIRPNAVDGAAQFVTTALPLAVFDNGITLANRFLIASAFAQRTTDPSQYGQKEISLIPWAQRFDAYGVAGWPAATVKSANTLILLGDPKDWTLFSSVTARAIPAPAKFVNKAQPVDVLPDDALNACADALGAFLARRFIGMPFMARDFVAAQKNAADESRATFLKRIQNLGTVEVMRIREIV